MNENNFTHFSIILLFETLLIFLKTGECSPANYQVITENINKSNYLSINKLDDDVSSPSTDIFYFKQYSTYNAEEPRNHSNVSLHQASSSPNSNNFMSSQNETQDNNESSRKNIALMKRHLNNIRNYTKRRISIRKQEEIDENSGSDSTFGDKSGTTKSSDDGRSDTDEDSGSKSFGSDPRNFTKRVIPIRKREEIDEDSGSDSNSADKSEALKSSDDAVSDKNEDSDLSDHRNPTKRLISIGKREETDEDSGSDSIKSVTTKQFDDALSNEDYGSNHRNHTKRFISIGKREETEEEPTTTINPDDEDSTTTSSVGDNEDEDDDSSTEHDNLDGDADSNTSKPGEWPSNSWTELMVLFRKDVTPEKLKLEVGGRDVFQFISRALAHNRQTELELLKLKELLKKLQPSLSEGSGSDRDVNININAASPLGIHADVGHHGHIGGDYYHMHSSYGRPHQTVLQFAGHAPSFDDEDEILEDEKRRFIRRGARILRDAWLRYNLMRSAQNHPLYARSADTQNLTNGTSINKENLKMSDSERKKYIKKGVEFLHKAWNQYKLKKYHHL